MVMEYCASHRHQNCSASRMTRPTSILALFPSFRLLHEYTMRARLNGMTIARKLLRKSGLPMVEDTLPLNVYGFWNNLNITSGKKCCRMPKMETMPDEINNV